MNPAVGIRPATAGVLDAVECVERRCFPEGEAFTRRQLLCRNGRKHLVSAR